MPWHLDRIDQRPPTPTNSYSWDVDGTGVTVYVVDSGVRGDHIEFGGRVAPGWSYRTDKALMALTDVANDSCKDESDYDPNDHRYDVDEFDFPNPLPTEAQDKGWVDNDGHGTHVAAIVGGASTGVAKGVTIVPVRVLNSCGSGNDAWFIAGLDWILSRHDPGDASVVNLSVGTTNVAVAVNDKITELVTAGIVVVGSAGNGERPPGGGSNIGVDACTVSPGSATAAIIVGSTNSADAESSYSNYGTCVDVLAPGTAVASAYSWFPGEANPYVAMSGTSMASPVVAGAAALRLQAAPGDTPAQVAQWITSRATGCAVTPYSTSRATQSPNLLVNVFGPATVPCAPRNVTVVAGNRTFDVSWSAPIADNGASITGYSATATPGGASCSTSGTSCTISDLVADTSYTVTVTATNAMGSSAPASTSALAVGVPSAPTRVKAAGTNGAVVFSWVATETGRTYTVRHTGNGRSCTTTGTRCTITGLRNGSTFTYEVVASSAGGQRSTAVKGSARAGFTVGTTTVRKGSRTRLSTILTTASKGSKRWSVSRGCRISGSTLVAPARRTTCTVTLSVGARGSFRAASTSVRVLVS